MKKYFNKTTTGLAFFGFILFMGLFKPAFATDYGPQGKKFGLGIILGEPSGVTGKYYLSEKFAIDGIVSWSFMDESLVLIADGTYEIVNLSTSASKMSFPLYIGVGAKLTLAGDDNNDDALFGIRVPIGIALQWDNHPFEVFFEIAPGFEFIPDGEFDLTGGIGARYYF